MTDNTTEKVTRVEVIDETGRGYIKYLTEVESVRLELQDENRTLKVFIDNISSIDKDRW